MDDSRPPLPPSPPAPPPPPHVPPAAPVPEPEPAPEAGIPRRRRSRAGLWAGLVAVVCVLLVVGAGVYGAFWAVGSPRGTAWLLANLARIGVGVQVVGANGSLLGDFSARQVVVRAGRTTITVDEPVWKGLTVAYTPYPATWARVEVRSLHASRVTIAVTPDPNPPPEDAGRLPTDLRLPVEVHIHELVAAELVVPGLAGYPLRDVRGKVHLGRDQGREHRFDDVSVRAEPLRITGHGHIRAVDGLALDVALDAVQADAAAVPPGAPPLPAWAQALRRDWSGRLRARGPLAAFDTTLSVQGRGQTLDAAARIEPDAPWPLTGLDLKTAGFDASALSAQAPATALSGTLRIAPLDRALGATGGLLVDGTLVNAKPGPWSDGHVPARSVTVDLRGRLRAAGPLDLRTLDVLLSDGRRDAGTVRASGHWDTERFDAKAELRQVRPGLLDPSLPAMTLSGPVTVAGRWPAGPDGQRAAVPAFEATAQLAGRLAEPDRAVQLRLDAKGDGTRIDLHALEAVAGGAKATASGHAVRQAGGAWQVVGRAGLADFDPRPWFPSPGNAPWQSGTHAFNLRADVDLAVPPAPATPGRAPDALQRLAAVRGHATVDVLPSVLAGVPLSGRVALRHPVPTEPVQVDAALEVDGNRLRAEGQLAPNGDGARDRWTASADLAAAARLAPVLRLLPAAVSSGFLDGLAGQVTAEAQVRGRWPRLESDGRARVPTLRAGPLSLDRAEARWTFAPRADAPLDIAVTVDDAGFGTQRTSATSLTVKGTPAAHQVSLRTELRAAPPAWAEGLQPRAAPAGPNTRTLVTLAASGALGGGPLAVSDGVPLAWNGSVQQLEVRPSRTGATPWVASRDVGLALTLGDSPHVVLSPGRADLLGAGLRWERIDWQAGAGVRTQQLDMQAQLEPLDVAPLLARLQPEFGWGGDLRIGGKVNVRQTDAFSAEVVLERVSGDLAVTDDGGTQPLGLTDLVLSLTAADGVWTFTQGLAGKQLGVAAGAFVARTSPQRAWPDADAPLQGVLEAQVENLGTWGAWVPNGWRLGGRLRVTAGLGGRFGAPEYTGRLVGNGVAVRNILEGVDVTDGEVDVSLKGDTARIETFTAKGGTGTLTLSGDAVLGASPRARLTVDAQRFQVLGRIDRRIVASGRGTLDLNRERAKVDGRFDVDEGLIDFTRSDAPALSGDVIVSNRSDGEPLPPAAPTRRRDVQINLVVGLGDRLQLRGRGIDTGLKGELTLTTPNGLPAFNGSIRTDNGTYAAYSQKLAIDRGVITFTGPVNDPRLDIEATRPNLDVRVGVAISGSALNPRVRLFSDPDMSDTDKLSWLMLGRASDGLGSSDTALLQRAALALLAGDNPGVTDQVLHSIGLDDLSVRQEDGDTRDTVVSVGKQISRRWYVGYERGLNATQGTWQLIYRIAQRFTLRAESGTDNAISLIWTWRWD